ncbi:MAG TPA: M14 family zinc carboxypeptidase [Bacteroidales bacterium]|nr:M14 family zinc carboxypeptidase [Bacteroidales bacterium]
MKRFLLTLSVLLSAVFSFPQGILPTGGTGKPLILDWPADASVLNHYYELSRGPLLPPGYHTYEQIVALADSLAENFPSICKKVMFGTSVGGRELAALKISDSVNENSTEPAVVFDGGIHGDEIGGPENMIRFARDLCLGYGNNPDYTDLIDHHVIWIYYMVNPDGRANNSRFNNHNVDCNRDFGYMWDSVGGSPSPFSQPETKALHTCIFNNLPVIYINYHSGAQVLAYSWNYRQSQAPDNTPFGYLAYIYTTTSGYPNLPYGQGYTVVYPVNGCTMDSKYGSLGNISYTMEISADKAPSGPQMIQFYEYNLPAMLEMIRRSGNGLTGNITDSVTGKPVRAIIWADNYYPVYNDSVFGNYHKYLLQGYHTITVTANGYVTRTFTNVGVPQQGTTELDVKMVPDTLRYAYKVMTCVIPGNNFQDEGYTPGALGAPDNVAYSLGFNGYIVLDMGDTIFNGPGYDFTVYEAGNTPEGFFCYAGATMDGPWVYLGSGTGTTSFELGYGSLQKARYIKIVDDGIGETMGPDAGYDLDAVQILTPPLAPDFTVNNPAPCTSNSINFTDQSGGHPTLWLWSFPGGTPSSSTQQNPSGINYTAPGIYNVSLTISNGFSSSTLVKTGYIQVSEIPVKPETPAGSADPCNTEVGIYTISSIPYASSYEWSLFPPEAGAISGQDTAGVITWDNTFTGNAFIRVRCANYCGEGPFSDSLEVAVRQGPVVDLGPDTTVEISQTLLLDAGNPGDTYLWSTGATTQTIVADSSGTGFGTKTFWARVTNTAGCSGTDTILVTFTPDVGIPPAIAEDVLKIYPNPSNGKFTLAFRHLEGSTFTIRTLLGEDLLTGTVPSDAYFLPVDLSPRPKGMYLVTVATKTGKLENKIIIY